MNPPPPTTSRRTMASPESIPEAFDETVRSDPQRTFLVEKRAGQVREFSYGEVQRCVDILAGAVAAQGVGPGDKVALIARNSCEWPAALLAVLRLGATAVPLHSEVSQDEARRVVKNCGARLVLGSDRSIERLSKLKLPALAWPEESAAGLRESLAPLAGDSRLTPADALGGVAPVPDPAVIMYTSGTTAKPKGVMLSHRNFLSNIDSFTELVEVGSNDRLLMVLPLHHVFPLTVGLLASLRLGASLALEHDVRQVAERMAETRPTIFFGVPALYDTMLRTVRHRIDRDRGAGAFDKLTGRLTALKQRTGVNVAPLLLRPLRNRLGGNLRFMVSGGAPLDAETHRGFLGLGIPLLQGYGLTEASPACAAQPYSLGRFLFTRHYERLAGSVGQPLPGLNVTLADAPEQGIRAGIHGEGELLVHGPNVMMGYYDDEEATREVIENGWLHTGDLARIEEGGWIYITGRVKDIIVLDSGENVHPGEVEEALAHDPLLADSCLATRGHKHRDMALVVYPDLEEAGMDPGLGEDRKELQRLVERRVQERLRDMASYKRPVRVIVTGVPLPRTLLGKVKRYEVVDEYLG